MANVDAPSGFKPVRYMSGGNYAGEHNLYLMTGATGDTFVGDAVIAGGTAGAAGTVVNGMDVGGMQTCAPATAGATNVIGVVVGFLPDLNDLSKKHRTTSTNRIAMVADNPNLIFEVQEDAVGAPIALADVGENADIVVGAGSTVTGVSAMELDSSTHVATTAQLRILRFVPRPDNEVASANAKLEVFINEHAYRVTAGT